MSASISHRLSSAAPAKKVLAALTAAVLVGHWLALGGRIPLWSDSGFKARSTMDAVPDPALIEAGAPQPSTEPASAPMPIRTSTVRWIAPPAPPPPPPPPPKPKPVVRKAPPPPPPTVSEAIEALGDLIPPLSVDEMMDDIAVSTEPDPEIPPPAPTQPEATAPLVEPPTAVVAAQPVAPPTAKPAIAGPVVPEGSLPSNATLSYDVKGKAKGFNYSAGGTLTWRQSGNAYEADLEISAFLLGSFQRTSTGLVTPQGLAPERYVDRRRSNQKSAVFDREAGVIRYSKKTPDAPLLPGAQDQLSVTLQLAGLLNAREQLVEGDVISVPVSGDSDSEIWRFEIGAVETLQLPAGEVTARRLVRQSRKPNDKTVEVWLSPNLGRLPVRVKLTEPNGDYMDQLLGDMPEIVTPPTGPSQSEAQSEP